MTTALAHRGPNGGGTHVSGSVGLGNRRLAIIDLEGGRQPLSNEDGTLWITFNGEIYNYRALRQELLQLGHVFRTNSDTETIVHAYEQWGEGCLARLRGMFAFAIHDTRRQNVFMARDQLGIKPLYYYSAPGCFAFASELQALKRIPGLQLHLDLQALDQYLWLQYIPAPKSIFKEVKKLPPAHHISIDLNGAVTGPTEYWRLTFEPLVTRSESEWLVALDELLRDSVEAHLVADVPFGAFLSGGVDSSAIVAYMAQILNEPVRTFSIGFQEAAFNELPYAAAVAQQWQTQHYTEVVEPQALEILPQLVQHYGEPFGDSSAIPTYYVSRLARRHVPMVLSGDGGDENFAGYNSYRAWMTALTQPRGSSPWKRALRPLAVKLGLRQAYPTADLASWLSTINYLPGQERRALWRASYHSVTRRPLEVFEAEFARARKHSPISLVQYLDLKTYLPNDILTKVDVASMLHGLEARTPLVDVRVAEFAATIPAGLLMAPDGHGQWDGKRLFKQVLQKYYSADFLNRPKMGFSVPLPQWFAPGGVLSQALRQRLLRHDSLLRELFEPAAINQLLNAGRSGPLWLLLFLDEWFQQNSSIVTWSA